MTEKNQPEKLEPVVTGEPLIKKKSGFQETLDLIIEPQEKGAVRNFFLKDIIAPEIKSIIWNFVTGVLNMYLFNSKSPGNKSGSRNSSIMIDYGKQYRGENPVRRAKPTLTGTDVFEFERITFPTQKEALDVLDQMYDILSTYQLIRVSKYLELAGSDTNNYLANKFGWTSLNGAEVVRQSNGDYYIRLPKAYPLDQD